MKRKDYHSRLLISASVETDRWRDFQELCDKERKSYSFKINELISEELEKNEIGDHIPINILYGKQQNKPLQADLVQWMEQVHEAKDDSNMLNLFEGMGRNIMVTAKHYLEENRRRRIMRK